jgi:hypothetical protein
MPGFVAAPSPVTTTLAVTAQPTFLHSQNAAPSLLGLLAVYTPIQAVTDPTPTANHGQLLLYVSSGKDYG